MAIRASDLPHCKKTSDCAPLCKGCGFCACLDGICARGCPGPNPQILTDHHHGFVGGPNPL